MIYFPNKFSDSKDLISLHQVWKGSGCFSFTDLPEVKKKWQPDVGVFMSAQLSVGELEFVPGFREERLNGACALTQHLDSSLSPSGALRGRCLRAVPECLIWMSTSRHVKKKVEKAVGYEKALIVEAPIEWCNTRSNETSCDGDT